MGTLKLTRDEELILKPWLTLDEQGERVLAGLTLEESIWHIEMGRAYAARGRQAFETDADRVRYWQEHERNSQAANAIAALVQELKNGSDR